VQPDRHGEGIGGVLLERAETIARSLGVNELRLYTNAKFAANLSFYVHRGFEQILREPHVAGDEIVHMKKHIEVWCPEPEVRGIVSCPGRDVVSAEAFDGSEDIVCGLGPSERLWVGIVVADEGSDVGAQGIDASMDAASDLFIGQQSEEALDLIEPRRIGRRQMHMPARPLGEPCADQRCFVGGVIVHDEMNVEFGVAPRSRPGTCGTRRRDGDCSTCR
jgi:hypothetical protein